MVIITAVKRFVAQVPSPTHKHRTTLKRPARDEQSNSLRYVVNYHRKKFHDIVPLDVTQVRNDHYYINHKKL
jgi:hypothetical protein